MRKLIMLGLIMLCTLTAQANCLNVDVFTTTHIPTTYTAQSNICEHIYDLNKFAQGLNKLNTLVKTAAKLQAQSLFDENEETLRRGFAGLILAQRYGVTQLPTIVFNNGQAETIGLKNVNLAILRYQKWLA